MNWQCETTKDLVFIWDFTYEWPPDGRAEQKKKMKVLPIFTIEEEMKAARWWTDFVSIDRVIIECNTCPACHRPLEYRNMPGASGSEGSASAEPAITRAFLRDDEHFRGAQAKFSSGQGICERLINKNMESVAKRKRWNSTSVRPRQIRIYQTKTG